MSTAGAAAAAFFTERERELKLLRFKKKNFGLTLFPCRHVKDWEGYHKHDDRTECTHEMTYHTDRCIRTPGVRG